MASFGDIGEQIVFRKEHNFNKKLALSKIGAKETPHWGVDRPGDVVACSCCLDFPLSGFEPDLVERLHKVWYVRGNVDGCIDDSKRPYSGYRGEL